jgi:hypothetical protein
MLATGIRRFASLQDDFSAKDLQQMYMALVAGLRLPFRLRVAVAQATAMTSMRHAGVEARTSARGQ